MKKYNKISMLLLVFAVLFCISAVVGTVSAVDTENTGPTVTANLTGGTYNTTQTVALTSNDNNATIYYANDTTDPRNSSTRITYTTPIIINKTTTLRYAAVDTNGNWSPLYLQNYVIGTGVVTNSTGQSNHTGPQTNTLEWSRIISGLSSCNAQIIGSVTGSIVIGSDGTVYVPGFYGFYAFNPDKSLKWVFDEGTNGGVSGTPAIAVDGTIYVVRCNDRGVSTRNVLYALNPDGTVKWGYTVGMIANSPTTSTYGMISTSPIIGADGTIYFEANTHYGSDAVNGVIYALNPDGTLKWNLPLGGYTAGVSTELVIGKDGTIYFGQSDGIINGITKTKGKIYAVNPDGTIKWTYDTNSTKYSSPGIGTDGTIYIGGNNGTLYAFNEDGTLKWNYTANAGVGDISISKEGIIYFGTSSADKGTLYAMNPDGTLKWKYIINNSSIITGATIGADGTIYIGGADGSSYEKNNCKVHAINPDGTLKWSYTLTPSASGYGIGVLSGSPTISSDGTLYFGTDGSACSNTLGMVYAISDNVVPGVVTNLRTKKTYTSIQAAIDDPDTQNGDNIKVSTGNYTENVIVNKSLTITAYGSVNVTAANNSKPVFTVTSDNSAITGFHIIGGWAGISLLSAQNCTIHDNLIQNYTNYMFYLNNSDPQPIHIGGTQLPTIIANMHSGTYNSPQKLTLSTEYGMIYYTTDGSDPTINSPAFRLSGSLTITNTTTVKYMVCSVLDGYGFGFWSPIYSLDIVIDTTAPAVNATPTGGFYNTTQSVTLTANENATIYYTIDGTNPTKNSTKYTGPIIINRTTTLKYMAVDAIGNPSQIYTGVYTIDTTAPTVTSDPGSGTYNKAQSIILGSSEPNSTIYYTTDGSTPTKSSKKYTGPFTISNITTLKFAAVDLAGNWSPVYTEKYTIDTTKPTVTANIKGGLYNTSKTIYLKMSESGTIYYTKNGATPTTTSTKYTGPISITSTTTLKYIAVDKVGNKSPVYTQKYTIDRTAPKVTSVYIKRYASGYSRTGIISIRFSESIKASINWSKVVVKNKYGKAVSISKSISGNTLYIKTNSKRSSYSYYTVYIPASAIKDYAGNNFAKGYTFKFKTGKY